MTQSDQLRLTLDHLHQELDRVSASDPEVRALLLRTISELSDKLAAHERGEALSPSAFASVETVDLLRASAREFEARHPALATALESVVDALSRMGI